MSSTIDPTVPVAPVPTASAASHGEGAPQPEARSEAEAPRRPEPIALDVRRGEDGVFVYTLSDPATGRLMAVIPDTAEARTAGNYASGGWVSLTA